MQPLARAVPRLFFESIASPSPSRLVWRASRPSSRPSICLRCRTMVQSRQFADSPKPPQLPTSTPPPPPPSNGSAKSPATPLNPKPSAQSSESPLNDEPLANLPSALENRRLAVTKKLSKVMDDLQGNIFLASQRINDLTGYSGIEALKQRITSLEKRVADSQELVRSSRLKYQATVAERAATQRETTALLARKDSWTSGDLERFTHCYRMDHSNEQAVQQAATSLADAEREAEHAASKLSSSILSRYHEEQIWSDKIRRMSTWGTWGLMGVNALLFLVFQFGLEPWRRKRLTRGFEEKVRQALEEDKIATEARRQSELAAMQEVPVEAVIAAGVEELPVEETVVQNPLAITEEQEQAASLDVAELHFPWIPLHLRNPETWLAAAQAFIKDSLSERPAEMRRKDVTIIALESFATGSAIMAIIATILLRPS